MLVVFISKYISSVLTRKTNFLLIRIKNIIKIKNKRIISSNYKMYS